MKDVSVAQPARIALARTQLSGQNELLAEVLFHPIDKTATNAAAAPTDIVFYAALDELFDEMGTLLARCLSNRRLKQELEEKFFLLWLESNRDLQLVEVREKLSAVGEFSVAADVAALDKASIAAEIPVRKELRGALEESVDARSPDNPVHQERIKEATEVTSYLSPASSVAVKPHATRVEELAAARELSTAKSVLFGQRLSDLQLELRQQTSAVQEPYLKARVPLKQQEIAAAKIFEQSRAAAMSTTGSPINFSERVLEAQRLFDIDFVSAQSRAVALCRGLKVLLHIDVPLPPSTGAGALIDLTVWMREALEQMISRREQSSDVVLAYRLEPLLRKPPTSLPGALKMEFDIPEPVALKGMTVGIRQVRLFMVSAATVGPISAKLSYPPYFGADDHYSTFVGDVVSPDPMSRTGLASGRGQINRSPFGSWELQWMGDLPDPKVLQAGARIEIGCRIYA